MTLKEILNVDLINPSGVSGFCYRELSYLKSEGRQIDNETIKVVLIGYLIRHNHIDAVSAWINGDEPSDFADFCNSEPMQVVKA